MLCDSDAVTFFLFPFADSRTHQTLKEGWNFPNVSLVEKDWCDVLNVAMRLYDSILYVANVCERRITHSMILSSGFLTIAHLLTDSARLWSISVSTFANDRNDAYARQDCTCWLQITVRTLWLSCEYAQRLLFFFRFARFRLWKWKKAFAVSYFFLFL